MSELDNKGIEIEGREIEFWLKKNRWRLPGWTFRISIAATAFLVFTQFSLLGWRIVTNQNWSLLGYDLAKLMFGMCVACVPFAPYLWLSRRPRSSLASETILFGGAAMFGGISVWFMHQDFIVDYLIEGDVQAYDHILLMPYGLVPVAILPVILVLLLDYVTWLMGEKGNRN